MSHGEVFHPLERAENLRDGYLKAFTVGGCELVLVQVAGVPSVLEGVCPHAGRSLGPGRLVGSDLRCDMHGYLFDVVSGACTYYTEGPCRGLRVYRHEVRDGQIGVWLNPPNT
jgi:nitrite reductase/ring-hydroxylating ferredoxin subunit